MFLELQILCINDFFTCPELTVQQKSGSYNSEVFTVKMNAQKVICYLQYTDFKQSHTYSTVLVTINSKKYFSAIQKSQTFGTNFFFFKLGQVKVYIGIHFVEECLVFPPNLKLSNSSKVHYGNEKILAVSRDLLQLCTQMNVNIHFSFYM